MADLVVRRGVPGEERAIATVHVGTWQTAYRGLVPDTYLDSLSVERRVATYNDDLLLDDVRPTWVAVRDDVVGFATAGPSREEEGNGELYAIYVNKSEWGSGAAAGLMELVLDFMRPRFDEATLWVLRDNDRARRFYEKHGWFFDGTELADDARGFVLNEARYRIDLRK